MKISSLARNLILVVLSVLVLTLGYSFVRRMFFKPPMDARIHEDDLSLGKEEVIQLKIVNATSTAGIAKQTTDYLRRRGFDVVLSENTVESAPHSYILRLRDDTVASQKLGYALGVNSKFLRTELDSSLMLDCVVVLGDDYQTLKPFK